MIPLSWSWRWTGYAAAIASDKYDEAIARGREWIEGMQSRDGGFAAFDADNLEYYLNNIPFSDHGRCSIRRPRTSPRDASRCWRSSARP